jgi:hypothetical protein
MKIPINLPRMVTETQPIDTTIPYNVVCRDCVESDNRDKNDNRFFKLKFEVMEPDEWKGKTIMDNYMPLAEEPAGNDRGEWRLFEETNEKFMRFITGFHVDTEGGFDPKDAIGCEGIVTATSEKFGGRNMTRVENYLL